MIHINLRAASGDMLSLVLLPAPGAPENCIKIAIRLRQRESPMSKKLHAVIQTFPEFEGLVRKLSGTNPDFDSLCHEYSQVTESLHGLEPGAEADTQSRAAALKRRRNALADELHAMMSANMRA